MINLNLTFLSCFTSQFYKWKDWNDQAQQLGDDDDGDDDDDDDDADADNDDMDDGWV